VGTARLVTPNQARAVHFAYDRLCRHLGSDSVGRVPADTDYVELTHGNLLAAETLAGILAKLRGRTFDQILDDLPERDEGCPPGPAAKYMWENTIHQLRYLHAHSWQHRPEPSHTYALPTAFRSSFNVAVASVIEVAAETKTPSQQVASLLRDAAAAELK
jgi:hypothetical protein